MGKRIALFLLIIGVGILLSAFNGLHDAQILRAQPFCEKPGWFPTDFGLKDHSVFWHNGYYYLVSNHIPDEDRFAYGRSMDLCSWESLPPVITDRNPGTWDESAVWAPFVLFEDGLFYMYYTGISKGVTQSIMLATSADPGDPDSWKSQGMIFQPDHPGMVWSAGTWADCRDPVVLKVEDIYYLFYTGLDQDGGIIGVATSASPVGPWIDWGRVMPPLTDGAMAESPFIVNREGYYYLFYRDTAGGEAYLIGASPSGPWMKPLQIGPGWAHEFWRTTTGRWFTSYLTGYSVTISPLTWDAFFSPALPFIGVDVHHVLLPGITRGK